MEELEYRREMNRNYMVIHPTPEWDDTYTVRMISGNKIPGLLAFQEKRLNGVAQYYYDITSKQPLGRILEYKSLSEEELRALISALLGVLKQMERFLLDPDQICIQPEYIYLEPESFRGWFCLIPGRKQDFSVEFSEFAQYILDHVDHSDGDAVVLAFSFFRLSRRENFGIEDIEGCLGRKADIRDENLYEEKRDRCSEENNISAIVEENFGNDGKTEPVIERHKNVNRVIVFAILFAIAVIVPVCTATAFGIQMLNRWKWGILFLEMLLMAVGLGFVRSGMQLNVSENRYEKSGDKAEEELWEKYFIEEEDNDDWEQRDELPCAEIKKTSTKVSIVNDRTEAIEEDEEKEDDMQTILLTSMSDMIDQRKRTLVAANGETNIPMNYFPFLIGKSKSMADFCLNEPGVSRLHVKIEESNGDYFITDLNSTNGTRVNGELLRANETRKLFIQDELSLAGVKFWFQ